MLTTTIIEGAVAASVPRYRAVRTLADVRDTLVSLAVGADTLETKLQISAINTVARASRCAPEDLPADPERLRPLLKSISPAMAGLTKGRWSSVRSRLLKALQRADIKVIAGRRTQPLSPQWAKLYQAIPSDGRKASLGRLIGFLSERDVGPLDVCDAIIERFDRELHGASLRGRPTAIVRSAIRGWNAAVDRVPTWPQQHLTLAAPRRDSYVLPAQNFSPSFQTSLAGYIAFLADPPDDDDAPWRGLRPRTLALREFQFRQMASALIHRGVPIEEIADIFVLTRRDHVDAICEFFVQRQGPPAPVQLLGLLAILRPVARHHLHDKELADWIGRRSRRLSGGRGRRFGMTEKNRRRLSVFRDPQHVRDLLLLPFRLLKRAESGTLLPHDGARLMRAAVAIELELMCPIRLQNLSEIDVDADLVRSRSGKRATVNLFIPGKRTKNGEDIELELPAQSVALIELYLAKYRNQLIHPQYRGTGPRYLFPKPDGTAKTGAVLANGICRVLMKELGTKFNVHLFRHLGCFLYLRSHPGQIDVIRRVLGHRHAETTMRFYAFVEQSDAFRLFDEHVLRIREEALRPSRKCVLMRKGQRQ